MLLKILIFPNFFRLFCYFFLHFCSVDVILLVFAKNNSQQLLSFNDYDDDHHYPYFLFTRNCFFLFFVFFILFFQLLFRLFDAIFSRFPNVLLVTMAQCLHFTISIVHFMPCGSLHLLSSTKRRI